MGSKSSGRRTILEETPGIGDEICTLIREGKADQDGTMQPVYPQAAARIIGLDPETVDSWLKRGYREHEGIFRTFFSNYQRAKGEFLAKLSGKALDLEAMTPADAMKALQTFDKEYLAPHSTSENTGSGTIVIKEPANTAKPKPFTPPEGFEDTDDA